MPEVRLKTGRIEYKITVEGKYTILKGDSGTGKSTFHELVSLMNNDAAAVTNSGYQHVTAMPDNFEAFRLELYQDYIIVADESCSLFRRNDAASILKASQNYFIFITRKLKLGYLPVHTDSVLELKNSGKFNYSKPLYKRFGFDKIDTIDSIVIEDKKSSYYFLQEITADLCRISPAYGFLQKDRTEKKAGASKICDTVRYEIAAGAASVLVIYDAAAFAQYTDSLAAIIRQNPDVKFYILDWDSFETYILNSIVYNQHITLSDAGCVYESLEQYASEIIKDVITGYSKSSLPFCLSKNRCISCKYGTGCHYRTFGFEDLLYGSVRVLFKYCQKMSESNGQRGSDTDSQNQVQNVSSPGS